MSTIGALNDLGRVSTTAIMLACGATDDELEAVFAILRHQDVPEGHLGIVRQVRAAIEEVRGGLPRPE